MFEYTPATPLRACATFWLLACGCAAQDSDPGTGSAHFLVDAEDSITDGIAAGDRVEDIADGWSVSFDRYLVAVGPLHLQLASDPGRDRLIEDSVLLDLTTVGTQGELVWEVDDLAAAQWQLSYTTPVVREDEVTPVDPVSSADAAELQSAAASHLVQGRISKTDGRSCPPARLATPTGAQAVGENRGGDPCFDNPTIDFRLLIDAAVTYGPCEVDGMEGFSVPLGGTRSVALSIHGDHMFFNGFPDGSEGGVTRLAQWLADCDLDLDGEVTRAELESIGASDLPELDGRYNLDLPFEDLRAGGDMWSYLRAQLRTQGHFEGEGECAYR